MFNPSRNLENESKQLAKVIGKSGKLLVKIKKFDDIKFW